MKIISIEEIKQRIFDIHGDQVKIIEETFINTRYKLQFLDKEFGIFETFLNNVIYFERRHPQYNKNKKILSFQEVKERIYSIHGEQIEIIEETYSDFKQKCYFFDKDYGLFEEFPYKIFKGKIHPLKLKEIRSKPKVSLEEVKERIFKIHGDQIKIVEEVFVNISSKCEFEDIEFGRWQSKIGNILKGSSHPKRKKEKTKKTCQEKYNVDHISQVFEIKQKQIQSNLNRTQKEKKLTREKTKQTFLKNFNVEHPLKSFEIKNKIKKTCKEKYNCENPFQVEQFKEKAKETMIKNHGVKNCSQSYEIKKKKHKTSKRNGTYGKSVQEDNFYEFLLTIFEKEDIERQYWIKNWPIDFYIKSKCLFIQFDGEYWHGLDQPLEELKLKNNPRAISNLNVYYKDLKQNQWFLENNLKLFRVICKDYKKLNFKEIKEKLLNF